MPEVFLWTGKNPKGRKIKGEFEAESADQVRISLQRRKITPIRVKKKPKDIFENISFLQPPVKENDVIVARCLDFTVSSHGENIKDALNSLKTWPPLG